MNYADFLCAAATYRDNHRAQRSGQAFFNYLALTRPELADEVRGTGRDPFHSNGRLPEFLEFVREHLAEDGAAA